ncbi:YwmB family TATA-box binding protein [Peribacillus tepidiphilus]|uniref:YwmB family TATA-box binding protein n=1 Tax=Peribacillus tepidiphilus TaxID=2652445 RepID=UPI0035B51142
MKKMFVYLLFLVLTVMYMGYSTTVAKDRTDLGKIIDVLQANKDIRMDEWSITARENIKDVATKEDFFNYYETLHTKLANFQWEVKEHPYGFKVTGKRKSQHVTETIEWVSTLTKEKPESYLLYVLEGNNLQDYEAEIHSTFESRLKDTFRHNPAIFTCVKGFYNDTIDKVLFSRLNRMMASFQAKELESVREEDFVSVSLYSPIFSQSLTTENLNLQIAMRSEGMGGRTSFIVGTPIITFEY